jgi:hypothetical protein
VFSFGGHCPLGYAKKKICIELEIDLAALIREWSYNLAMYVVHRNIPQAECAQYMCRIVDGPCTSTLCY